MCAVGMALLHLFMGNWFQCAVCFISIGEFKGKRNGARFT
jgi:hypothetical protein